jgi:5-enolpyruvylshikimate-3-phosphate synthase
MSIHSGMYTLADLTLDYQFSDWDIHVKIPADRVQEKLREIGYEIGHAGAGKTPVIIRGESPKVTLKIESHVRVSLAVTKIQAMLRTTLGEFDIFEHEAWT